MSEISVKERLEIPRQAMPTQDHEARRANFVEVAVGYTPELMLREAQRCLQCREPACVKGCPVGVIPA